VAPSVPGLTKLEPIGGGGMGEVYKAYQPDLDRLVAVKTVRPELLTEAGLKLFRREAKLLAKLKDTHIVQILEFHPEATRPYFLMEYVDGQPLDQALSSRTWMQRARVFERVVGAVAVAHAHGVIHGDLKPANILVDRSEQPHILDFGLGHMARAERLSALTPDSGEDGSGSGNRGGTLGFLAPEILLGGSESSILSDIYALGATLYVMLTGVLPFATRGALKRGELRLPLEYNADIPEPLQRICLKAMELRQEDRYQTSEQLHHDLERFLVGEPVYVRPTYYEQELAGRVCNHTAVIQMWEKEGLISRRERDALIRPYDRLGRESPWLSETRRILGGPLLIRLGAWLLLISAVLWPVFYWDKINTVGRLASSGIPMALMGGLGLAFVVAGQRRNAIACLGAFTLLMLVFVVVWLSEFGWFRYLQQTDWELWGPRVARQQQDVGPRAFIDELVLSNSQVFVTAAVLTGWIALLVKLLRAPFFASWLAAASVGLGSAVFLLCGDLYRLDHDAIATVSLHYLGLSLVFFVLGYFIDRRASGSFAGPFYAAAVVIGLAAAVAVARFGVKEWFDKRWSWDNETWNLWILCYAAPLFAMAWALERFGTETQRRWSWVFYVLTPLSVHMPLQTLFETATPTTIQLRAGRPPLHLYEALTLPASVLFISLGKWLRLEYFLYAGLGGLAVSLFRATNLHFDDVLGWPLLLAKIGACFVVAGVYYSGGREWLLRAADWLEPNSSKRD
jgi:predicted Ser/Thr protein kinase